MKKGKPTDNATGLSTVAALKYMLKGNMLFAANGIVVYFIDMMACQFPPLFQQVYTDNIITHKNSEWFTPLLVLYILLFLFELAIWIIMSVVRRKSQAKLTVTASSDFLWTVLRMPMERLSRFTPGELVARYTTIGKAIKQMDYALPSVLLILFPMICCSIIMLFNWKLGLLEVFSILLLAYVMRVTAQQQKRIAMDLEVTESRLQNITMTGMKNLDTIKALGGERFFFAQWEKAYAESMNARVTTTTNSVFLSALPLFVLQFVNGAMMCLGAWFILQGELTPGMILASQGLVNESIYPINKTIDSLLTILRTNSSIKRIKDVTDCRSEAADLHLVADDELPDVVKLAGEIELRDVTFGYDRSLPPIISHFSLRSRLASA